MKAIDALIEVMRSVQGRVDPNLVSLLHDACRTHDHVVKGLMQELQDQDDHIVRLRRENEALKRETGIRDTYTGY